MTGLQQQKQKNEQLPLTPHHLTQEKAIDIWRLDSIQEVHDVVDIIWPGSVCLTTFFRSNAYIAPPATAIVMCYGIFQR